MTCGKKILIVLAAALAVAGPAYAITGGTPDGQGHPAVGLLLADAGPAGFQPDCTGALVAPDVFVTAAHCFIGTASNHVLITFDAQASPTSKFVPGSHTPIRRSTRTRRTCTTSRSSSCSRPSRA